MILGALIVCATIHVWDGDSFSCDGQNMRLLGGGIVNKVGIDTPEIGSRAKCDKERRLALIAKGRLREILEGERVRIEVLGADRSKRPLVNLYLPSGDEIGQILLKEGHAREWRPGKKVDWCR